MATMRSFSPFGVIKTLFKKYQEDRGNIIVSSISFYILLTFIPFTLFSICLLGYIIDLSNPAHQLEIFVRSMIPAPYDSIIVHKILDELNPYFRHEEAFGTPGGSVSFCFSHRAFSPSSGHPFIQYSARNKKVS